MGGQTQENISQNWLTPEALIDFIEELRHIGFNIGMAEYIAAQDLLLMLTARGESLQQPQRAASLLGPLLCSSPAEQDAFPEHFERWAKRRQATLAEKPIAREETMAEALDDTAKRGLRWEWILFALGVLILSGTAWYLVRNFMHTEVPLPNNQPPPSDTTNDSLPLIQLASVAVGLLILAYVAWWAWWRRIANQFLQRRQGEGTPDIKQISLTASDEALFPSLTFLSLARMFRQRVQVVSRELNVVRTVEHSVKQGGWLNPIYDHLLIPPEYLVLVDRRSRFDHLAEFVEGMVKRLETHGVFITAYAFDGDPRLCFPLHGKDAPQSLNELAARYDNMRLIVFSEAQGLLNPVSGRLAPWSRLFNRWIHRSVLTPESPANWGATEHELQREFTVLPGTADGLAAFMRIIQGQEKVGEINAWADSAIPSILQERPQRWIERDAPPTIQIDVLLEELKTYLGEDGYTWFEACAVYPELQWQITITLGQLLKDGNGTPLLDPKRMIDLARLPWFRFGIMPDWLRMHLVLDLAPNQEEEVRAALEALLVTAVQGHGEALDLEVAHERREWTSQLARPLLRLLGRDLPSDSPIQDHVFLGFMHQRLNLAVRVPETLRRQLFTRAGNQIGWKVMVQWTIANLLVAVVIILFAFFFPLSDRPQSSAFVINSLEGLFLGLAQWLVLRRFWKLNGWLWLGVCVLGINATSSAALILNGFSTHGSQLGFLNLTLMSLMQTGLLARKRVPSNLLWWLGGLLSSVISTILLYSFVLDNGFATVWHMVIFYLISAILYSVISGWILLELLRSKTRTATWLLRANWVLSVAASFTLGLLLGALIAIALNLDSSSVVGNATAGTIWALAFVLSQWVVLRSYHLRMARSWFWATLVPFAGGFALLLQLTSGLSSSEMFSFTAIITAIGIGILVGLVQALVWYRNGLTPYQLLIWFLSSVIGISLTFVFLFALVASTSSMTFTVDQNLLLTFLPGLSYVLVTAWPLKTFLEEAMRHEQASKETKKAAVNQPYFGKTYKKSRWQKISIIIVLLAFFAPWVHSCSTDYNGFQSTYELGSSLWDIFTNQNSFTFTGAFVILVEFIGIISIFTYCLLSVYAILFRIVEIKNRLWDRMTFVLVNVGLIGLLVSLVSTLSGRSSDSLLKDYLWGYWITWVGIASNVWFEWKAYFNKRL